MKCIPSYIKAVSSNEVHSLLHLGSEFQSNQNLPATYLTNGV